MCISPFSVSRVSAMVTLAEVVRLRLEHEWTRWASLTAVRVSEISAWSKSQGSRHLSLEGPEADWPRSLPGDQLAGEQQREVEQKSPDVVPLCLSPLLWPKPPFPHLRTGHGDTCLAGPP